MTAARYHPHFQQSEALMIQLKHRGEKKGLNFEKINEN
jgi:hypothetical protein